VDNSCTERITTSPLFVSVFVVVADKDVHPPGFRPVGECGSEYIYAGTFSSATLYAIDPESDRYAVLLTGRFIQIGVKPPMVDC
jgi:hypothetical protein